MTYIQIFDLKNPTGTYANFTPLKKKIAVACAKAASDVLFEDPQTAMHAERYIWARGTMGNAEAMAEQMMWGVLQNPVIQATGDSAADSDVQFVVNGLVNLYI